MKLKLTPRRLREPPSKGVMIKGVTTCKHADRQEAMTELASLKLIYTPVIRTVEDSDFDSDCRQIDSFV
jgi:hypothetical protein